MLITHCREGKAQVGRPCRSFYNDAGKKKMMDSCRNLSDSEYVFIVVGHVGMQGEKRDQS